MKHHWLFAVGMTLAAGALQAQQLTIRSGDHPTFSRVTIPLPANQSWEAIKTEQGIELTLPGFSGGFDTSEVFSRMRTDRIIALDARSGSLLLKVDCACDATAFPSGSLLVIDVADAGTALAGPPLKGAALAKTPSGGGIETARAARPAIPWIGGNSPFEAEPYQTFLGEGAKAEETPEDDIEQRAALLRDIQQSLAERVANAASIGLLEDSYEEPAQLPAPLTEPSAQPDLEPEELPEQLQTTSQNIRISSSLDLPDRTAQSGLHTTTAGLSCPDDASFAVETWGDDSSFSAQVGPARNALMNARDMLDRAAAKRLAQLYIYFGFGAEALDALHLDPTLSAENPHLAAMATILERGDIARPNALSDFVDCDTNIALWATLSFQSFPPGTLIDTDAALRALNNLPKHLRQVVAPALSDRFLKYGDAPAAAAALRSIERLGDPFTHDAMMSQAALALDAGRPAEAYLTEVIEDNSTQSPDALVRLVEETLAKDQPLSSETATLVEAYVQELRGTEMGYKLRQTQIMALGQSGRFEEAFDALVSLSPSLSPEGMVSLKQTLFEQLAKSGDDLEFLEYSFAEKVPSIGGFSASTRMAIATRLQDLGFAAQVQQILSTFEDVPRRTDRQLLAARAALSLRQPYQAQAALVGTEGPEAAVLLAEAKQMIGEYSEASQIFSDNNAQAQAARAAWLSDEWQDLTSAETPSLGAAATLARTVPDDNDTDLGPLGRATRALQESSAARETLEQLLRDPIVQMTPES